MPMGEIEEVVSYDSYIVRGDDLALGEQRLLDVDNRLVFPYNVEIRGLFTSADVLHS